MLRCTPSKKIVIFINLYLPIMDALSTMAIFCFQGVERFDCIKITEIDLSLSLSVSLSLQRRHYALKWQSHLLCRTQNNALNTALR